MARGSGWAAEEAVAVAVAVVVVVVVVVVEEEEVAAGKEGRPRCGPPIFQPVRANV